MAKKATNHHFFLRMVKEVELSRDWFGSVFIVDLNIPRVFAETVTQSATRFITVDEIDGNARKVIGDGNSTIRSGNN